MTQIWTCKIGEADFNQHGADMPMRVAVAQAYKGITGHEPEFCFSGWGGALDEAERAVVENRLPDPNKTDPGERAIVQLAGCLVAAEGGTNEDSCAKPGDYGYSVSYEKVLLLRRAFEKACPGMTPEQVLLA